MGLINPENVRQILTTNITTNVSTTSTSYIDLLSLNVTTTANSFLIVNFSAGCSNSSTNDWGQFKIVIDEISYVACIIANATTNTANSGGLVYRLQVATGTHTVKIQWLAGGGGTLRIRPTSSTVEHAVLTVKEVLV